MRYFDQLGEVIARLLGFRKRKDWKHAHEYLDEVADDFLRIDFDELKEGETTFQQLDSINALTFFKDI